MGGRSVVDYLLNPTPNLLFAVVILLDIAVAVGSAATAIGLDIALSDEKAGTSVSNLWHLCSGALGAFFGLLGGSKLSTT